MGHAAVCIHKSLRSVTSLVMIKMLILSAVLPAPSPTASPILHHLTIMLELKCHGSCKTSVASYDCARHCYQAVFVSGIACLDGKQNTTELDLFWGTLTCFVQSLASSKRQQACFYTKHTHTHRHAKKRAGDFQCCNFLCQRWPPSPSPTPPPPLPLPTFRSPLPLVIKFYKHFHNNLLWKRNPAGIPDLSVKFRLSQAYYI